MIGNNSSVFLMVDHTGLWCGDRRSRVKEIESYFLDGCFSGMLVMHKFV